MAAEPVDYARLGIDTHDPIRFAPTTTGFYLEIIRPASGQLYGWIVALAIVGAIATALTISEGPAAALVIGILMIWLVERAMSQRNQNASLELDGDQLIVHHGSQKQVFNWQTIKRFESATHVDSFEQAVLVTLVDGQWIQLFRSNRAADVERLVTMLNKEREQR
jgi:hypothetical protein